MNVLILGGNGFIGKNLSKYLVKRGCDVRVFDVSKPRERIEGIEYVAGNFFSEGDLLPYLMDIDVVIHAISSINPGNSSALYMQGYDNDFAYSIKLADYSVKYGFRIIFLSSGGTVYGDQKIMPIKEDALPIPINHYGNIKLCIENTYRIFNKQTGADIKIARIANPYGPGQDYLKGVGFIDAVVKCAFQKSTVHIYGDGTVVRDYIYIDDVCAMLGKIMEYHGEQEVFNIGTGIGTSQEQIIGYVKEIIPELKVDYFPSRTVDVPCIILDNSKIAELYQEPCVDIKTGIMQYYSFIENCSHG